MSPYRADTPATAVSAIAVCCAAVALLPDTGQGATLERLHVREVRQQRTAAKSASSLAFFRSHPRAAHTLEGHRKIRRARIWLRVARRELKDTRAERNAKLAPRRSLQSASAIPGPMPPWWLDQAACIRSHEGAWSSNTGNGYYGAYQFLLSTWQSVGGGGYPHLASPGEQTYRAWLVWSRDGGSWREWGTAGICGLR